MAKIWKFLCVAGLLYALLSGQGAKTAEAVLASGGEAVGLLITLMGTLTLWSGMLGVMRKTGDVRRIGRALRRVLRPLFRGVEDEHTWEAISLNLSANLMGLGNAATPAGIEASKRLSEQGENGRWALAMLLVLDNAGLQWLPTTVISLRAAAGAAEPAGIWGATVLSAAAATVTAVALMLLVRKMKGGRAWQE